MNYNKKVIDIVYETVAQHQKKYDKPLEQYDNWKDEIIELFQDYIEELSEWNYTSPTNSEIERTLGNGKSGSRKEQE